MRCNTYPSKTYYADYTMSLNDEKVQLYGEFAKIDPFEFWDLDSIDNKLSKHLSKLKKRHWMYIVYPESAPKDWMQQLEATGVKFAVSPLHDKDKLVDGKYKKKHWHVILIFDGPTTFMTAASYIGITNGPYPKVCESGCLKSIRIGKRYMYSYEAIKQFQKDYEGLDLSNKVKALQAYSLVNKSK